MQGGGEDSEDGLSHIFQDQRAGPRPTQALSAASLPLVLVLQPRPEPPLGGGKRCCHRSLRTPSALSLAEAEKSSASHSLKDKPRKAHWLRRPRAPVGSGGGPRSERARGSRLLRLRRGTCAVPEAAPGSCPARAAGGSAAWSARVGSGWAMEPLAEPAPRPGPGPRCVLLLPLLLLLLPAPDLGPRQAQAEETDWVRLPSKCEGEGAGPAGSICRRAGLAEKGQGDGRSWASERESLRSLKLLCAWHRAGRWGPRSGRESRSRCIWSLQIVKKKQLSRIVDAVIEEVQGFGDPVRSTSSILEMGERLCVEGSPERLRTRSPEGG